MSSVEADCGARPRWTDGGTKAAAEPSTRAAMRRLAMVCSAGISKATTDGEEEDDEDEDDEEEDDDDEDDEDEAGLPPGPRP